MIYNIACLVKALWLVLVISLYISSVVVYYFHKALLIQGRVYRIRKEV